MIRTVVETGSTNADLLAEAATLPEGIWLRAERQTGGRGRLGRQWQSPAGNLYASTLVRLRAGDPPAETLALVAGVAVHETAATWAGDTTARLRLKWPNDLLADGAKLTGTLLERAADAVVIGFGVNLARAPKGLDRPVAALADLGRGAPDPALFLDDLAAAFARALQTWRSVGLAAIRRAWLNRALPSGTPMTATTAAGPIEGLFEGLTEEGAMRLRRAGGTVETITAGDVSLL